MKRILLFLLAVAAPVLGAGQNPRQAYINKYSSLAVSEMQRTGVPASITLAQAILESGAGQSPLATKAHNHFGLKCHNDWKGERFLYDDETPDECFRVYPTAEDSYRAHSDYLLEHDRYKALFDLEPGDYQGWARGLRRAGYATDPGYATKLINLIEDFQLYRFDELAQEAAVTEQMPEMPAVTFKPEEQEPEQKAADEPEDVKEPEEPEQPEQPERQQQVTGDPGSEPGMTKEEPGMRVERPERRQEEPVTLSFSRPTYEQNGVRYIRAVEGDTWESIAAAYGLFPKQLLKYNDLSSPTELKPGNWVYLGRKKPQAAVGRYLVQREDETLWDISQMFGVQLKKLRLYNIFRRDEPLKPGDTVILRKLK